MVRPLLAGTLVLSALVFTGTTLATPRAQPSERSCLIAWNSPTNHANRVKLLAQRPIRWLQLGAGNAYTVTWKKGSTPTQTGGPACLMTVMKRSESRVVTGRWTHGHVSRWTFGRLSPASDPNPLEANVRLLPDGRVTKIYR